MVIRLRLKPNMDLKAFIRVLLSQSQMTAEIFLSLMVLGKSFLKAASCLKARLDLAKKKALNRFEMHAGVLQPVQPI